MSEMKILLLSKYDRLGASSRVRSYQYLPYLEDHDMNVTIAPLLGNSYIERLYSNKSKNPLAILRSYLNRVIKLVRTKKFDAIWVEKEFLPWFPAIIPSLIQYTETPYLVDYDDAIFHQYDNHSSKFVRSILGTKIDKVIKHADVVTVGNEYLANRAECAGANRIEYLPTVVDLQKYSTRTHSAEDAFTIGWVGSPTTADYLHQIQSALSKVLNDTDQLVLVGSGNVDLGDIPIEIRKWSEDKEVSDIKTFDVGIMPLPDCPWERGKCGYKLIQYMACGVPVVASPVGVNEKIVDDAKNGFLAYSSSDWIESINHLRNSPSLREQMGNCGRKKVEQKYSLDVTAPRLYKIIESLKK